MKTLNDYQFRFTIMIASLIIYAYIKGYSLSFGDAFRDRRTHGNQGEKRAYGRAYSAHKNRLAIDFNLFKNGVYLSKTEDHAELGKFWKSLGGTWGGDFNDGNHYSLEYNGVK